MFCKEFPPGLFYQVRVLTKCLSTAQLKCSVPGWDLLLLGAGGSPRVAFEVVPPKGVLSTESGEGCCLLGLGDQLGHLPSLGTGAGGAAKTGCSSTGEALLDRMNGGDRVVCPNKMWYEVARVLLSSGGLVYRAAWQVERKLAWLLLSSWMTCISKSCMMLPCSLWSVLAWEALWASISLMAEEQAASASQMIWPWVVLASLTAARQVVLASRITQEQLVLASRVNWEHGVWALRVA